MKAAVVSLGSISSQWIIDEMKKQFDTVDEIDLRDIDVSLGGREPGIFCKGEQLKLDYGCIFARGSFRYAQMLRAMTTLIETKSQTYSPLQSSAFTIGHDKFLTHLALQHANVMQPQTSLASTPEAGRLLLTKVNYPLVIKLPSGTHGKGVMIAESVESANSVVDTLALLNQPFLMQEFIETEGTDIRAFVVGDEVVAAMKRKATKGEMRSNVHLGGTAEPVRLSHRARLVAVDAARALGCDVCGVDLLEGVRGPMVIEVNLSPGLQGITKATNINIAKKIAEFLHKKAEEKMQAGKAKEVKEEVTPSHEIMAKVDIRGDRILLPSAVTTLSRFTSQDNVLIKAKKGNIHIEKDISGQD